MRSTVEWLEKLALLKVAGLFGVFSGLLFVGACFETREWAVVSSGP